MHTNSRLLFEKYARGYFKPNLRVLEIGPDGVPSTHQRILNDPSIVWETIDILDDPKLTYRQTGDYTFPVADGTYDVVLSSNVLEHVRKAWVWMREVARVTKAGGHVITVTPVSWPFHEAPVDCWRTYPEGLRALHEEAGLETVMAVFESLEGPGFKRYLPGRCWDWLHWRTRGIYHVVSRLGFPAERAYDTIGVARKPGK
jgi:SAM-dependent methyltransferase